MGAGAAHRGRRSGTLATVGVVFVACTKDFLRLPEQAGRATICLMRFAFLLLTACSLNSPLCWAQNGSRAPTPAADSEQAKREHDFKMAEIIQELGLTAGSKVADLGAGDGDYEPALSRAVGVGGRVYAEDIREDAFKELRERIKKYDLKNVDVIEGAADDPRLPDGVDGVLMVIMYHEISDPPKMLQHVLSALRPNGRLVVVDMAPHKTATRPRADQVKNHVIASSVVESEVRGAGFALILREDHFIDNPDEESTRWIMVFRKPAGQAGL